MSVAVFLRASGIDGDNCTSHFLTCLQSKSCSCERYDGAWKSVGVKLLLTSALDGGEGSASISGCRTPDTL
jgi:hypothetical protein